MFHYWNGGRLYSEDVAGTEWLKEGFTEYVASRTVARNGQITPRDWEQMLGIYMGRFFSSRFMQAGDKPSLHDAGSNKGSNWRLIYGGSALPPIAEILAKAGWHVNHVVDEYYLSPLPQPDAKAVAIRKLLLGVEIAR